MSRQTDEINLVLTLDEVAHIANQLQTKKLKYKMLISDWPEGSENYEYYKHQFNVEYTILEKLSLASKQPDQEEV
ncbi:MAG: hypothetical protein K0M69_13560 [Youngiibacter sp.]|nr:hypothetical protein [Youngiibacter sp.]